MSKFEFSEDGEPGNEIRKFFFSNNNFTCCKGEDGVPGFAPVLTDEGELTDGNLMYDYESNMLVKRQYPSCIACPAGPQGRQKLAEFRSEA